jgi:hypothetical protein
VDLDDRLSVLEAQVRDQDIQQWRVIGEVSALAVAIGVIAGEPDLSIRPKLFVRRLELVRATMLNQPISERNLAAIERGLARIFHAG